MESDIDYIFRIKENNDRDSIKALIDKHSGIYVEMINRYLYTSENVLAKEDFIMEKDSFIYNCAKKFDPSINVKFSTYLGNQIKWKCLNYYNSNKNFSFEDIDFYKNSKDSSDILLDIEKNESMTKIMSIVNEYSDKRAVRIFLERYMSSKDHKLTPWKKIAKKLDLSIQGCINIHDKLIKHIKQNILTHKKYE
jgi:DNA-directed RNA polymerase specialized sigma subunit